MPDRNKGASKNFLLLLVAFMLVWLLGSALIHFDPISATLEQRGQLGDCFSSINALFAGLAFAGVIYAILLQREELMRQREELKLTRDEIRPSNRTSRQLDYTVEVDVDVDVSVVRDFGTDGGLS